MTHVQVCLPVRLVLFLLLFGWLFVFVFVKKTTTKKHSVSTPPPSKLPHAPAVSEVPCFLSQPSAPAGAEAGRSASPYLVPAQDDFHQISNMRVVASALSIAYFASGGILSQEAIQWPRNSTPTGRHHSVGAKFSQRKKKHLLLAELIEVRLFECQFSHFPCHSHLSFATK